MTKAWMLCAVLAMSAAIWSQTTPPAKAPVTPAAKHAPAAKTDAEFAAYKAVAQLPDPAAMEKGADDFAVKFPDSDLKGLLYKTVMRTYQGKNDAEKTEQMGRKVLALDGDDPEALVMVAEILAERTRDTDLDKAQRYDEAMKLAQHATQTVDTDSGIPSGTPEDKAAAYKGLLLSNAYSVVGTLEFKQDNFAAAETNLRKSMDAFPQQPDPTVVLRLALSLDKQGKYPEALKFAEQAVTLNQEGSGAGKIARQERDRLVLLVGPAKPAEKK